MRIFDQSNLRSLEKQARTNLINALAGIRPANLIGTIAEDQTTNLAIFNSVMHIGADPALMGFIMRPTTVKRDTYENIVSTQEFSINHVNIGIVSSAHHTSARFEISEFEACRLSPEYGTCIKAPYVQEASIQIGLKLAEIIPIELNQTKLIIGEIHEIRIKDETCLEPDFNLNLELAKSIGVNGLDSYYSIQKLAKYKYAKPNLPPEIIP
jgi:flavin reductase (DIM6/NTAB) family NADH-FMN oxidoreductase RutF